MAARKRSKLKDLNLGELSVCKNGMNQRSSILITKSAEDDMKTGKDGQGPMQRFLKGLQDLLTLAATGKDGEGNVVKSEEDQLEHIKKGVNVLGEALESEVPEPVAKGGDADDDFDFDEEEDGKMAKALDNIEKAASERVAKAEAKAQEAMDAVTRLTKAHEHAISVAKATELVGNLPADLNDVANILKALPADQHEAFAKLMKGANALANMGLMTHRFGTPVLKAGSAEDKLTAMAKAKAEKDGVTFAKAYVDVSDANPDLYAEAQRDLGFNR